MATPLAIAATERLAWLIIAASIPAGILGLALEHQLRTLTAKPKVAAIFLMVNGCVLLAAERFRRRAEARELATDRRRSASDAAKPDGARELATLEYRKPFVVVVDNSARPSRWKSPEPPESPFPLGSRNRMRRGKCRPLPSCRCN